jgi:hypothetical protein
MSIAELLTDWSCPSCGAGREFTEIKHKYVKSAPRWHGWPAPPPTLEFDERILVGSDILIRCPNGHGFSYFEYVPMAVNNDD